MEEIDGIIIDSLKHLDCDIDESIEHLKQFDADLTVLAVSTCLEAILQGQTFPKKLPPNMSLKLKIASNLAEQIKELGFRGDMGYQTILYCNEVEIRRVLMFLIERLPRDSNKTVQIEQVGYVPNLHKNIEESLKMSLKQMWLPSSLFSNGFRKCGDQYIVQSFGTSRPLRAVNLQIPNTQCNKNDSLKQYWVHSLPDVTKQCSPSTLLPSLLFKDTEFCIDQTTFNKIVKQSKENNIIGDLNSNREIIENEKPVTVEANIEPAQAEKNDFVNTLQKLLQEVEAKKGKIIGLQENIKQGELQLSQVINMKNQEQEVFKDTVSKVKLKTKTRAIIDKQENFAKLKTLVDNGSDRLIDLANQWNEVQTPLLNEYRSLQNNLSIEEIKAQEEEKKLNNLKELYKNMLDDLKEKEILEKNVQEKVAQINKSNNRSGYTRRILEIIGNIQKQKVEIQKVLQDTKAVQKEINNLTGQVERSFTLSDELIFQDARDDETARKAYKLLAALREECGGIFKAVDELGLTERESRNLQDQVETEKSKETLAKLDRVQQDLEQIKTETEILLKK